MNTPTLDLPTRFATGGAAIYRPVAVRSALATVTVVAGLYCFRFTRGLPIVAAETVSFIGILLLRITRMTRIQNASFELFA